MTATATNFTFGNNCVACVHKKSAPLPLVSDEGEYIMKVSDKRSLYAIVRGMEAKCKK